MLSAFKALKSKASQASSLGQQIFRKLHSDSSSVRDLLLTKVVWLKPKSVTPLWSTRIMGTYLNYTLEHTDEGFILFHADQQVKVLKKEEVPSIWDVPGFDFDTKTLKRPGTP